LFSQIKNELGSIFYELASCKEFIIKDGHIMKDDVYMLLSITYKYSVTQNVDFIKGKSEIWIVPTFDKKIRDC
jgi:putative transposase